MSPIRIESVCILRRMASPGQDGAAVLTDRVVRESMAPATGVNPCPLRPGLSRRISPRLLNHAEGRTNHPIAILALAALYPLSLAGQVVSGRVLDSKTHAAVPNGLVQLIDAEGRAVQSTSTSPTGRFVITAPAPSRYRLRVAAIGYVPPALRAIVVGADGLMLDSIVVTRVVFRLPDLVALSQQQRCGAKRILSDDIFGGLVNAANTTLGVAAETIHSARATYDAVLVNSIAVPDGQSADTIRQRLTRWPLESVGADTLRDVGFGRVSGPGNSRLAVFYGPDAGVLFSDWFLDQHCFTLQKVSAKSDTIHIKFAPLTKGAKIDVSGELAFDAHRFDLLSLSFQAENLPRYVDKKAAGGEIRFTSLRSGLTIPASWTIWGPVQGSATCGYRVVGLNERRGAVVRVLGSEPGDTMVTAASIQLLLIPRRTTFDHERCLPPVFIDPG
jgi:Carboxypeptidase regulatory-like domain